MHVCPDLYFIQLLQDCKLAFVPDVMKFPPGVPEIYWQDRNRWELTVTFDQQNIINQLIIINYILVNSLNVQKMVLTGMGEMDRLVSDHCYGTEA